ncbi:MAG: hypothetical protein HS106_05105 [Ideonella sp.]|nr:MAG: hypothetical protein F9K36_09535 [Burkholderiaceae bacterium]MBE7425417.1 hypothetical protein [Ideonella sp.]
MRSTTLFASLGMLAALVGSPVLAGDHSPGERGARHAVANDHGMREVAHSSAQGEPGHGWQYFSDPAAHRAVVISPQGDYYLSRGKGLRLVFAASRAA